MVIHRENDTGQCHRHTASTRTAEPARMARAGQPAVTYSHPTNAVTAAARGWRRAKRASRHSTRASWATMTIQPGVRYTGDRHAGTANGSGLRSWATCEPVTTLRINYSPLPWANRERDKGRPAGASCEPPRLITPRTLGLAGVGDVFVQFGDVPSQGIGQALRLGYVLGGDMRGFGR